MAVHEILGPVLVRFDLRPLQAGSEAFDPCCQQLIADALSERIFRSHRNQIDRIAFAPCNYRLTTKTKRIDRIQ